MTLLVLAFLGGILTILSPCILPVLPFVFARADRPFLRNGLPMLIGMTVTFAIVATLAAVAGGWAVAANQYGRWVAAVLLAFFGLTLLFPSLSDRLTQPLVGLGGRLSQAVDGDSATDRSTLWSSAALGVATGLLWAPCAGPVLGLILTGAALQGANAQTTLLLLSYALGAATSLALALLIGGRLFVVMKRSLGVGEWIRRGLGAAVIAAVIAIALGLDTGFLTNVSLASTTTFEQKLLNRLHPSAQEKAAAMTGAPAMMHKDSSQASTLPVENTIPNLNGATQWLNSPPLSMESLRGKVVLVDFWTYSCINCIRALPYVRAWADKYKDQGLVVVGVHAPEFAFEKNIANVTKAVADLKINYPVAIDNEYKIWRAFENEYWPAHYFIDAQGRVRHHHFGDGKYDESERVIQQLLAEAGHNNVASNIVNVSASGAEASADLSIVKSPETYIGYDRAENFVSPGGIVRDTSHDYEIGKPALNQWGLSGSWTVHEEHATSQAADGTIIFRFHARDLHLVLGPGADGKPVRYRVTIDGAAPENDHGTDTGPDGSGVITEQRLYQLIRQKGPITDHTFEIRFLDSGVQAYAFTFG